jgi:hypothetical protein
VHSFQNNRISLHIRNESSICSITPLPLLW